MLPVSPSVILTIVGAVLRHRGRVDQILAQSGTTQGLPFRLPPTVPNRIDHLDDMVAFFKTEQGEAVLALRKLEEDFKQIADQFPNGPPYPDPAITKCFNLYFEAARINPRRLPNDTALDLEEINSGRPSEDFRLAFYVVESQRLSRNPTITRIVLATADTLLETLSENTGLLIKDEVTRKIFETAIDAFALEHDFDDEPTELIFKRLLGAVAVGVARNGDEITDSPAMRAFLGAVRETQEEIGADDVANLVNADGLQATMTHLLTTVASDPSFLTKDKKLQASLKAVLSEVSSKFPELIRGDQGAVLSLIEAVVKEAAKRTSAVLDAELNGDPLTQVVLKSTLKAIQTAANQNMLFKNLASGRLLGEFYRAALAAVAENPEAVADQLSVETTVAELIAGFAQATSNMSPGDLPSAYQIVSLTLAALAKHPKLANHSDKFGPRIVAVVLEAASPLVKDGLQESDLIALIDTAVLSAAENVALLQLEEHFQAIVAIWAEAVSSEGVKTVASPHTRLRIIRNGIRAMARNPALWKKYADAGQAKDLVVTIIEGLLSESPPANASSLFSGPVFAAAVEAVLDAVTRRIGAVNPRIPELMGALKAAVAELTSENGLAADAGVVPLLLAEFVHAVLDNPDILGDTANMQTVFVGIMKAQLQEAA